MLDTLISFFSFSNDPATTEIYTLSLHDALPISFSCIYPNRRALMEALESVLRTSANAQRAREAGQGDLFGRGGEEAVRRSEEHTSELQSHSDLVCRLLLEKKKNKDEN